jgi:glutamate carboxypeptidase
MSLAADVLAHLRRQRDEMAAYATRLVALESPSRDAAAQEALFGVLGDALEEQGFRLRRRPGAASAGVLLALPRARRRPGRYQVLLGHGDTVWPRGTLVDMPARREGGTLRGPGVYDMKGGLVQGLYAVAALRALQVEPEVAPVFLVNSDEEVGSVESTRVITRLARRANRVFVLEPAAGEEGRLKTARKGVGRFRIRVKGVAAHAGLDPEKGVSAILELSHVIQNLFALNDPERGITVNVGTVDGGLTPNVVAPESSAVADVRVLHEEDVGMVEATIRGLEPSTPGTTLEVEGAISRPPMERTPGNRRLWQMARGAAAELGVELEEATVGGGSDGNTTSRLAPTLDGLGAVGAGAHAAHEFLYVDRMVERAALLALLVAAPPLT